jgi:uncharacterized protein YndB with AHSA1/START domain
MTENPATGAPAEINITRVFDAPRELVWRAWTEPAQFADWFGGKDAPVPLETVAMDVRPGGDWKASMVFGGDAGEINWRGTYQDVVAPERLVFTLTDRPGDEYELCTVVLTDLGGRTQMAFSQAGGHVPADMLEQTIAGWQGFFDRMGELIGS